MSTSPIPQTIDILSREKGIDPQVIISAIEDAVVIAARKQFKTGEDLRARYNAETGDVELFALMTVVDEVQDSATEISLADVEAMGSKAPKSAISLSSRSLAKNWVALPRKPQSKSYFKRFARPNATMFTMNTSDALVSWFTAL